MPSNKEFINVKSEQQVKVEIKFTTLHCVCENYKEFWANENFFPIIPISIDEIPFW